MGTDYFVMEQIEYIKMPTVKIAETKDSVTYKTNRITELKNFDYIYKGHLVSDDAKQLLEMFLPHNEWFLHGYVDSEKNTIASFWRLDAAEYVPGEGTVFRPDGLVQELRLSDEQSPAVCKVKSPKGTVSLIAHLAVAESMLRRGIMGIKFTRI